MAATETSGPRPTPPDSLFATTRWSVVVAAGQGDTVGSHEALTHLCQTYWYPLYAYARRHGCPPQDAQDMTQEFFARLLEGNWLAKADRQRGRFRSFLLASMKHFMANEWNKAHALKRGGHQPVLSLDDHCAEERYRLEPPDKNTPESLYERGWALSMLNDVLMRLEQEYDRDGKSEWMQAMRPALTDDPISYGDIADKLGMTETAARVAVHRLRQRYRRLIRAEVASTVVSPQDIDEEMHHLFRVLAGG